MVDISVSTKKTKDETNETQRIARTSDVSGSGFGFSPKVYYGSVTTARLRATTPLGDSVGYVSTRLAEPTNKRRRWFPPIMGRVITLLVNLPL